MPATNGKQRAFLAESTSPGNTEHRRLSTRREASTTIGPMLDRLIDPLVRRVLHPPRRTQKPLPESLRGRAEDVSIGAGARPMAGWLVSSRGRAAGTVVLVHGWGGDSGRMAPLASHLVASGF